MIYCQTFTIPFRFQTHSERYWPDRVGDTKQYGEIFVETETCLQSKPFDLRVLQISNVSMNRLLESLFCYKSSDNAKVRGKI